MSEEVVEQVVDQEPQTEGFDAPESQEPAQPQQQEHGFSSPYEAFKALPDFEGQDDLTIARNLYGAYNGLHEAQRQLQQYQQVVPYAQEYLQNRQAFSEWQKSQAEAAQKQANPEPPKWWNPPQVKDTWKSFIVQDENGSQTIDPNAPLEAQAALREYQAYTADFARRLVTDPENALKPLVEQVATQKAQELVQQQLGQYQAQSYVSSLEQQNADWLYDENGNETQEARAVRGYIDQARQLGIQDPQARWKYATGMLQRDLLEIRYGQMQQMQQPQSAPQPAPEAESYQPPADPVAQQNMQFLRERATRTPNRSAGATEPQAPRQRMSFEERLKGQLQQDGVI